MKRMSTVSEGCDVVVDDKCCGYWLADYRKWGGHQREYDAKGHEIHAESTRLFMRAKVSGARRVHVDGATARHSIRRWLERPLREFASAGFPRTRTWQDTWAATEALVSGLPDVSKPLSQAWQDALAERRRHMVALFNRLPLHVASCMVGTASSECCAGNRLRGEPLPFRTIQDLEHSPGMLMEDIFASMTL